MEQWHLMVLVLGIQIVFGLVVAVLGFLVKRSISSIDKRLDEGDKKFDVICIDIVKLKETRGFDREYFAKEYISKDDYVREIRALDYKIELLAQDVKKILVLSGREKNAEI